MGPTNATACVPGGAAPPFFAPMSAARYGRASSQAHSVLGVALAVIIIVWGWLVVDPGWVAASRRGCYASSGAVSVGAGLYLGLWVVYLVAPDAPSNEVWAFARRDVIQLQHGAIAFSLVAAGLAELTHAWALSSDPPRSREGALRRLLLSGAWVHSCWFANVALVGLTFVGHPQRTASSARLHVALGASLLAGAYLLACDKRADFPPASLDAPTAAAFVGLAAVLLVAYDEPPPPRHDDRSSSDDDHGRRRRRTKHAGIDAAGTPGAAIAHLGLLVATLTILSLAVAVALDLSAHRPTAAFRPTWRGTTDRRSRRREDHAPLSGAYELVATDTTTAPP